MDLVGRPVAGEKGRDAIPRQAVRRREGRECCGVADVTAFGEIGAEDREDQILDGAVVVGEADQAVRIDGARRAADSRKREIQAVLGGDRGDRRVEPSCALLIAELARRVVGAADAGARHVRIEQERPPLRRDRQVRPAGAQLLQAVNAEIAPRADEIENDFDRDPRQARQDHVHGCGV